MRRLVFISALVVFLASAVSAPAATTFFVTGRGWGHGVGMSQWGAFALARQGKTYPEILAHYYRETTLASARGRLIGVLLATGRTSLSLGAGGGFKVSDGSKTQTFAAGQLSVSGTAAGRIRLGRQRQTFASPVTFAPIQAPLRHGATRYRGRIVVSLTGGSLRAVNRVGLEPYLKGVVPRESPDYWGASGAQAALEAQAVAARSYALGRGGHCGAGLFCPDTRDQVYGGYDAERSSPHASAAVDTTAGQVLKHGAAIATTYFHSSSGGRTAASKDVWGGDFGYLQSVPDYDLVPENPNRFWRLALTARSLGQRLGVRAPTDATLARDPSNLAQVLTVGGPGWSTAVEGSETLRFRLGVRSARFWIGLVSLRRSARTVVYGQRVSLEAFHRRVRNVALERRRSGGDWHVVGAVAGLTTIVQRPLRTTQWRLASSGGRGALVTVRVAPAVNFLVRQRRGSLAGIIRPRTLAGRTVLVERRQANGSWVRVAGAIVQADGGFRARFRVAGGAYRARLAATPSSGLIAGVSPTLTVRTG